MIKKKGYFFVLCLGLISLLFIGFVGFQYQRPKTLVFEDKSDRIQYGQHLRVRYLIKGFNMLLLGQSSYTIKPDVLYEHNLKQFKTFGVKRVFASVINKESDYKYKKTDVLVLPSVLKAEHLSYEEGLFFVSRFTHPSFYTALDKPVSRFQFAYALSALKQTIKPCYKRFSDLDDWQHKIACQAQKEEWVLTLKKDKFYPKESISMMQFAVALVTRLKLPLPKTYQDTFINLNPYHWSYPYVLAAYQYGLIASKDSFELQSSVSQKQLAYAFDRIKEKQKLSWESSIDVEYLELEEKHNDTRQQLVNQFRVRHQKGLFDVTFDIKPAVVSTLNYSLNGRVIASSKETKRSFHYKGEILYVNDKPVTLSKDGYFSLPVLLTKGKNSFRFRFWDQTKKITYWYEPIPVAFRAHWFETESHRLYALGFLKTRDYLTPNHSLTRGQFAELLVMLLDLKPKEHQEKLFRDLDETHPFYDPIQTVVSHRILNGANDMFMPDKPLTKLEALIGVSRAINLSASLSVEAENVLLPFQDINRVPWAISYIKQAYHKKLISKAPNFYPKKMINVAECLAMLYRSEFMSQKIIKRLNG